VNMLVMCCLALSPDCHGMLDVPGLEMRIWDLFRWGSPPSQTE
jgi:hypothetical protein